MNFRYTKRSGSCGFVYGKTSIMAEQASNEKAFNDLTAEQKAQLAALLEALDAFSTSALIVRCLEAVSLDITVEANRKRIDEVMAGVWAYDRAFLYLDRLRALNKERVQIGEEIHQFLQNTKPTLEGDVTGAARARAMVQHLAGRQEIVMHFMCVSIQHIRSLLLKVAVAVGYKISASDLDFLDKFRHLRNHFEHWYNRLPGQENAATMVTTKLSADEYRVVGGLKTDQQDRVVVVEPKKTGSATHFVDVTNNGVARVERIVQETATRVREQALDQVRAYFILNPLDFPSSDILWNDLLFSTGP